MHPSLWTYPGFLPTLTPIIEDNDLFISSITNSSSIPGPVGPVGPAGADGADGASVVDATITPNPGNLILTLSDGSTIDAGQVVGPPGPAGTSSRNTTTITSDYITESDDYYIGAKLTDAATVMLPFNVPNGTEYVIKLEYGAPVGTRKLTILPEEPAVLNGANSLTLTVPYQSVTVIFNNQNWYTI